MRCLHLIVAVLVAGLAIPPFGALAQESEDDEESPRLPGLIADYADAFGASAKRIDETLTFDWHDAAPDPRLAAGEFSAVWRGSLWTQTPGTHRLAVWVQGQVALKLGGKELLAGAADQPQWLVSPPLDLPFDYQPLEITYRRTGQHGRLALYWTGPNFVLEPVPQRFLFHDRIESPSPAFERGRQLAAALRCAACHQGDATAHWPAPALDRLAGSISCEWLVEWLSTPVSPRGKGARGEGAEDIARQMPHLGITQDEATAIADWLLRLPAEKPEEIEQKIAKDAKKSGKEKRPPPSADAGEQLFLTLGCLACHQHGTLGESGFFGGGDLTRIAEKRPAEFFARWLPDPASLNKHHRMPVFELTADERISLSLWLAQQGDPTPLSPRGRGAGGAGAELRRGEQLIARFRCAACHTLPGVKDDPPATIAQPLTAQSDWTRSCAGEVDAKANRPGYRLADDDRVALRTHFSAARPAAVPGTPPRAFATAPQAAGRDLLVQLNCLACHQREGIDRQVHLLPARLQDKLLAVAEAHSDLAKQIPAMTPPALNSVGDKLHDQALADAIRRQGEPHRPYLLVRMPKFALTDDQLATLTAYFVSTDRIHSNPPLSPRGKEAGDERTKLPAATALAAAGPRLVTTDGFGCTSCHQIGSVPADKAPINARGPNLSLAGKRIRREWFDRWCYSPARIVPRMEMPSVQVPVRGVLGDNVHDQLAAVWHTLNTPGFEPPEPNPIRVLRLSGVPERKESPIVLHDVIKDGDKTYLFPLVIGLPNRHNILFDLETNRLAAWWLGDTARQRTKGKSWWWEQGARSIFEPGTEGSEISLILDGKEYLPLPEGQFAAALHVYELAANGGIVFAYRLEFSVPAADRSGAPRTTTLLVTQEIAPDATHGGFLRRLFVDGAPPESQVRLRLVNPRIGKDGNWDERNASLPIGDTTISVKSHTLFSWKGDGSITFVAPRTEKFVLSPPWEASLSHSHIELQYTTKLPVDRYLIDQPPPTIAASMRLEVAPGFSAQRLPLPDDIMPTGVHISDAGTLYISSLKGQVFAVKDSDGDGLQDATSCLLDGLATPYGIYWSGNYLNVIAKTALYGLLDKDQDGQAERVVTLASGWGVTDDYHDWAIGLETIENGVRYIGLPCQQDDRSQAASKYRGCVLSLVPKYLPSLPYPYEIQVLSTGHRFPMGLALKQRGELFVTDNQGNYNPFNELNFVSKVAHFGFVNAIDKKQDAKPPPLTPPAIDIPHPWTRSVNGICFLNTPEHMRRRNQIKPNAFFFGPLEGHLIGCEYDTRRLIRMTLQKIGDTYQGAAYPLSIPPDDVEKGLLGPIVCAISPRGELYVGEIRDSGWGAGNNVGQIVKIKIEPDKLPCGIAEMKATADGFTLDFFQPVDAKKAADISNYSLQSYRRESTPAYGGPDLDRRTEKIAAIEVSSDKKRVTLKLPELRERFVYELRLKNLAPKNAMFHPDEAHFTLRQVPK